jgi:DNA-binding transcriptional MerR regulator
MPFCRHVLLRERSARESVRHLPPDIPVIPIMHEPSSRETGVQPTYRIGAAARLTGLSTHTLRKWEDRHALVTPRRSPGGERLYSAADVSRLALIKDLVEGGTPLGELAKLSLEELEELFRRSHRAEQRSITQSTPRVSVAVLGASLPTLLDSDARDFHRARIVASGNSLQALRAELGEASLDVVVIECPTVTAATRDEVADAMLTLGAASAVVVFGFGVRSDLDALRRPDVALVRAPADPVEIERLCLGLAASIGEWWPPPPTTSATAIPARRWSREELARIAGMSNSILCECPHHLADLIMSLDAFEEYSASCASRDDKDRDLHRFLRLTAASGRAMLEQALQRVAEHEGLDLD